jgi:hypothetical protein
MFIGAPGLQVARVPNFLFNKNKLKPRTWQPVWHLKPGADWSNIFKFCRAEKVMSASTVATGNRSLL